MRRGLISWSREEVPIAALDRRISRLQAAMHKEDTGALLAYTSFAQPSAVSWISHFVPYWSEALLVLLPDGGPILLAALTKRVHPWIKEVSHIEQVVMAPRLGVGAVTLLSERISQDAKVGIVGFDSLPWSVAEPLVHAYPGDKLFDASDLFATVRQPADPQERGLTVKALEAVNDALRAIPFDVTKVSEITSSIESSTRLAGAEEVLQRVSPDLAQSGVLARMEGDYPLGKRYAVEVSMAYKGCWVRVTKSIAKDNPSSWAAAEKWFATAMTKLHSATNGILADAPGKMVNWTVEACVGLQPLNVIMAKGRPAAKKLSPGTIAVFSVELELDDGPWHRAVPVYMGNSAIQTVAIAS